jgi:UDP-N-acetyl-D-glucosamine dehydrogenase
VLGLAYKKNVDDIRESPSLKLIELIEARGAACDYHDPFVPAIGPTREHPSLAGRRSVTLDAGAVASYDAVLIATDHDAVPYGMLAAHAPVVVDTRNACAKAGVVGRNVVKA